MTYNPCNVEFILSRLLERGLSAERLALHWAHLWDKPTKNLSLSLDEKYFHGRKKPSAFNTVRVRFSGFSDYRRNGVYHLMRVAPGESVSAGRAVVLQEDGTVRELQSLRDTILGFAT
jgi:hypothetical protein